MTDAISNPPAPLSMELLELAAARACAKIPPLWDLTNFVAVNPFLGFTDSLMPDAARQIADGTGARVYPPASFYKRRWEENAFGPADLATSSARFGADAAKLERILQGHEPMGTRHPASVLTFAQNLDRQSGPHWNLSTHRYLARWCSSYVANHPEAQDGLFESWLETASVDRSLDIAGLAGWCSWVRNLPASAPSAMHQCMTRFSDPADIEKYLYRLLGSMYGWASYFRRESWSAGDKNPGRLGEFLAVLVCVDAGVAALAPSSRNAKHATPGRRLIEDESVAAVLQDALEDGLVRRVVKDLVPSATPPSAGTNDVPSVQAFFCIDVRSEPFRRHLESESGSIRTSGFAGFFGVSLGWQTESGTSARCPVLLQPGVKLEAPSASNDALKLKQIQAAPASAFSFVELAGLAYGLAMFKDAMGLSSIPQDPEHSAALRLSPGSEGTGIELEKRVAMAMGILKNTGLRSPLPPLVLLCAHQSHSANNPHAAGLECGACGGHAGSLNARIACAILNDPDVRAGLQAKGIDLQSSTHFVPGVHDTSTDRVTLMDLDSVPASHQAQITQLQTWLDGAGQKTRKERAGSLGLEQTEAPSLTAAILRRVTDWSEVRPEWGLARNALFIAAPRARTRGVDLQGRSFLHDYDASIDPDHSILTLILSAPMVVASWINLQYFASTVDNQVLGAGTKTLHNRIDRIGVVLGNGGDLRTGLALQSVHTADGQWYHEPVRLQVLVQAPKQKIDAVLAAQPGVTRLVENGWVRLFSLDATSPIVHLRRAGGQWETMTA